MIDRPARGGVSPLIWPTVGLLTGGGFCLLTDDPAVQVKVVLGFSGVGVVLAVITWAAQRGGRAVIAAQARRLDRQHQTPETTAQRGMLSAADADDGALSQIEGDP